MEKQQLVFPTTKEYTEDDIRKVQKILLTMAKNIHQILDRHDIKYFITYGTLLGAVRHGGYIPWDDDFDIFLFEEQYDEALYFLKQELPAWMIVHNEENDPIYWPYWSRVRDINSETYADLWADDNYYRYRGIEIDLYKLKKVKRYEVKLRMLEENMTHFERKYKAGILSTESFLNKTKEIQIKIEEEKIRIENSENVNRDEQVYYFVIYNMDSIEERDIFPLKKYDFEGLQFWGPNNADALLTAAYGDYMKIPPFEKRRPHYSLVKYNDIVDF